MYYLYDNCRYRYPLLYETCDNQRIIFMYFLCWIRNSESWVLRTFWFHILIVVANNANDRWYSFVASKNDLAWWNFYNHISYISEPVRYYEPFICQSRYTRGANLFMTVHADCLVSNCAKPPTGAMLSTKFHIFFAIFFRLPMISCFDQMISFKMATEIARHLECQHYRRSI